LRIFLVFFISTLSIYAQELDKNTIIYEYQKTNSYTSLETKHDSIYKLSRKILLLQSSEALSLFKTLDSLVSDERLKLSYLMNWATSEFRFGNKDKSKFLRLKGLDIANKYGTPTDKYDYTGSMSNFYINIQQADSASYYCIAFEKLINQYPEELNQYMWSVHLKHYYIQNILGNEALIDESIEKSWSAMTEFPKQKNYGFLLYLITDHFRKRKNYEKQTKYAELLIEYYNKKKVSTPDAHFPVETVLYEKDSPEAINQLKNVVEASDKINSLNTFSYTSSGLARLYLDSNQPENAIDVLQRAITKLDSANFSAFKAVKYELLQKAYIQKKDFKSAYNMLGVQKRIEDSLRSDEQLAKIANFEVTYETQKKAAQIELLKTQNIAKEKQKQLYRLLALSGLAIAALLGFFSYRNRKQKRVLAKQKEELEETVEQKNMLFKEIHHRVKNSLQMVSSLLFLQGQNIGDKEAKNAIKDAQNRVRSLSLIHQKLYSRKHINGVATKGYFTDLTQDIFNSHQLESQHLNYKLDIENLVLNVDTLTPIGLILNELIVNVLKHAFKQNDTDSMLYINFYKQKNTLVLKVVDNGIGFNGTIKKNSFGLKLINSLAKKLDAIFTIKAVAPKGTETKLVINDFEIIDTI